MRNTTSSPLTDWVDAPRADAGLRTLADDAWTFHPYTDVAALVRGTAAALADAGVRPGDRVAIGDPDPLGFVTGFFGALHAGATPVPLPPRAPRPDEHVGLLAAILDTARPRVVLAGDGVADAARRATSVAVLVDPPPALAERAAAPLPDVGLLQFTSGSTGAPRGVQVTSANIAAHTTMTRAWLGWRPEDAAASWLPLHHDMGLIGLMISSLVGQNDLWQLRPEQFLWQPHRWIECFDGPGGAAITAAPTFGYGYAARRLKPERLEGLDLSGWTSAVVGAERLLPAPLHAFAALLAPYGLAATTLRPAYGLAEGTLAVTGSDRRERPRAIRVDWSALRASRPLPPTRVEDLDAQAADDPEVLLSCGRVLDGLDVRIVDEDGAVVADGVLGEIVVRGATAENTYLGDTEGTATRFEDGALHTGDAGFLLGDELFVVGRMADSVKVSGQRVYAETIEQRIAAEAGVAAHRCVVVPTPRGDGDGLVVLLEDVDPIAVRDAVVRAARAIAGPTVDVVVHAVPRDTIARTTSGKPRRRTMWQRVAAGDLQAAAGQRR